MFDLSLTQNYANAAIDQGSTVFQDIHLIAKNIAIYQRDINVLKAELGRFGEYTIECRASGSTEDILSILDAYFEDQGIECPLLLNDIAGLLSLFEKTTGAFSSRLLLTTVSTNMCRKFHSDINDLRLLCTYIGPGTLWLPDEAILHSAGKGQEVMVDETQAQQARTGDAVILKGALYPDANPILHRSPTIEEQGEKRLLLRIDTNEMLTLLS
jgi:hypothetical protein